MTAGAMVLKTLLLMVAFAGPSVAQIRGAASSQAPSTPPPQVEDPFGRDAPRGTIAGFTRAVDRGDFASAARYLQLRGSQARNAEALARALSEMMDRHFVQPIATISGGPDGELDDGLPADRERVGPLVIGDRLVDIALVRVTDPQAGPIWLISTETLSQVPALYRSIGESWAQRVMPAPLVRRSLLGVSAAQWILLAASIIIPVLVLRLLSAVLVGFVRRTRLEPGRRYRLDVWYAGLRWPMIVIVADVIHYYVLTPLIGLPLAFRFRYARVAAVVVVVAVAWLLLRMLSLAMEHARGLVHGRSQTGTRSLMLLAERLFQGLILVLAILTILTVAGVDTMTALAGFGIGGIAIALGAQKTVENLLGGIALLSDRVLAVGDLCIISNRTGIVEGITLRSIRLRTEDQTLLSIPAGTLSGSSVENFATRAKILMKTRLYLQYGTSAEQLRSILGGIRDLIADNPRLETKTSRARLVDLGERAAEIELFVYVSTSDYLEFLAVREEFLLRVATVVESSGSAFARPTQLVYMEDVAGVDGPVRGAVSRDDVRLTQRGPLRPPTSISGD